MMLKSILKYLKNTASLPLTEQVNQAELQTYLDAFQEAMDDDFNTANRVTVLFDMAKWINSGNYDQTLGSFEKMLQVFGIVFERRNSLMKISKNSWKTSAAHCWTLRQQIVFVMS